MATSEEAIMDADSRNAGAAGSPASIPVGHDKPITTTLTDTAAPTNNNIQPTEEPSSPATESKPMPLPTQDTTAPLMPHSETPKPLPSQQSENTSQSFQPQAVSDCYYTRRIVFGNRECSIICQNENGPCPLLALCNVLLLRGTIKIHPDRTMVEFSFLVEILTDVLLALRERYAAAPEAYEQQVQSCIEIFPSLQHGLDVNVKFDSCRGFEFTQQLELFDIFSIGLYHGWVVDPQDVDSVAALQSMSYNQLVEMIIASQSTNCDGMPEASSEASSEVVQRGTVARDWLAANQTQLTFHGMCELNQKMQHNEIGVLFRNNHFFCVMKRRDELVTLVTDQGFATTPVVWETLVAVNGDSHFLDERFHTIAEENGAGNSQIAPEPPAPTALELQQMYDRKKELQDREELEACDTSGNTNLSDEELARRLQEQLMIPTINQNDEELARRMQQQEELGAYDQRAPTRTADGGFYRGQQDDMALAARLQREEELAARRRAEEPQGRQQQHKQRSKGKDSCFVM